MKKPTKDDLREVLARCALELRLAAWCGMGRATLQAFDPDVTKYAPEWCKQASAAFDAMDAIGQDPAGLSACRALRPWVGEVAP